MQRSPRRPGTVAGWLVGLILFTAACGSDPTGGTMPPPDDGDPASDSTFTNPLTPSGPDPWLTYHDGNYYLATTTWGGASVGLTMRKAPTIDSLKAVEPVQIFQTSASDRCCNYWAPEFFLIDGPNGPR